MARSIGTRITEDWQPSVDLAAKMALKHAVTAGQISWMRDGFVEYFTGADAARPVKKDWDRAFGNWCRTDAAKAKRAVKQEQGPQPAMREIDWRWVASMFKRTGKWFSTTPEPGYGGCGCPRAILIEFGLLKIEARPQVAARASGTTQ